MCFDCWPLEPAESKHALSMPLEEFLDDWDFEQNELYYDGDEANELCMYLVLNAICQQLLIISDINNMNNINNDENDTEKKQASFDTKLNAIKQLFHGMILWGFCVSCRCLQLFSDIITLCENNLEAIDIAFKLSIKSNDHNQLKQELFIDNISPKLRSIYQQKFGSMMNYNDYNDDNDDNKMDEQNVKSIFDAIMDKLSKLKTLTWFIFQIDEFPSNCYDYYKYFNYNNNIISFECIQSFDLNLGRIEMAPFIHDIKHSLYEWIRNHSNLNGIRIYVKNYAQSYTEFIEALDITYKQRNDIKVLVIECIKAMIENISLCERIEGFTLDDEVMGIRDYTDILTKLFECKLLNITNLVLRFNDMRDVYMKDIIDSMIKSNYICNNLCVLKFVWINNFIKYTSWNFTCDIQHWVETRPDFICINDDENAETYFDKKMYQCMPSKSALKHSDSIQNFRDIHYAKTSILSLMALITKCKYLDSLEIRYFDGIDADHTKQLIDIITDHGHIDHLTLYGIKCNDDVCNALNNLFLQKHSFIESLQIMFSDNFGKSLTDQCLKNMINTFMKSTLYKECIECVTNTLFDIGYAMDMVKIITDFMFDAKEQIVIQLGGLDSSLKRSSKDYFDHLNSTISLHRQIKYETHLL